MRLYPNYQAYQRAWSIASQGKEDPIVPLEIDVELSTICNVSCLSCQYTIPSYKQSGIKFISVDMFRDIIKIASVMQVPSIRLNWIGEPTLHQLFNWMIEFAYSHDFYDLSLVTNGNYKTNRRLGIAFASKVIFSVDSFKEKTYKQIKRNGNYRLLMNNKKNRIKTTIADIITQVKFLIISIILKKSIF